MELDDVSVLVTGGGSGLGEASARRLHATGAAVVVFDLDGQKAAAVAASLGGRAVGVGGDAADEKDVLAALEAARALGSLRGVVACAGGGGGCRTVDRSGAVHSLELFERTVRNNLVTAFNTVRLAAAEMAKLEPVDEGGQRGAIVLTSSIAGYEGQVGQIAYGSAKAGVIGMTLIAARDLAAMGVRVNAIAPGLLDTPPWQGATAEMKERIAAGVLFPRRFGRPQEFADLALHLLTNDYLNGQVVRLDGGIRFGPR